MQRANLTLPYIPLPFAGGDNADRTDLISATGPDAVNFTDGIPPAFSETKYLRRSDLNAIGYYATVLQHYLQCGGVVQYDADFQTAIGGYPKGAIVRVVDVSGTAPAVATYLSLKDDNTDAPTVAASWTALGLAPTDAVEEDDPHPVTSGGVYDALYGNVVAVWTSVTISSGTLAYRCLDGHAVELLYTSPTPTTAIAIGATVPVTIGGSDGEFPTAYLPPAGKVVTAPFRYAYSGGNGMGQAEILHTSGSPATLVLTPAAIAAEGSAIVSASITPTSSYTARFIWLVSRPAAS